MVTERPLPGGIVNSGTVMRRGDVTLRPATAFTASAHRFLTDLRAAGFDGVPRPLGIAADGREQLEFVDGEVPIVPYPAWAQSDTALVSVVTLLRRFHDASKGVDTTGPWSAELADPRGGPLVCHNDVCLENVVFRDERAVALLDWEFAAPGRPVHDLAQMARMCIPVDDDDSARRLGWGTVDRPMRARLVCDAYGLAAIDRPAFLDEIDFAVRRHEEFVLRRVADGDHNVVAMWDAGGGQARYDRRRAWWRSARPAFAAALA